MTHTLHRFGSRDDLSDDYVVLAMPAKGFDRAEAVERQKEFLRRALGHGPVNLGDSAHGASYRSEKGLRPSIHWRRPSAPTAAAVIDAVDGPSAVTAVFDNYEAALAFVRELREADLGLSVNLSALTERGAACCAETGLTRHSVEYSLGFFGRTDRLPDEETLRLSTMCGHGMIGHGLARKMIDRVKTGRRTPEEASRTLARFCNCGAFNPSRARRILARAGGTA